MTTFREYAQEAVEVLATKGANWDKVKRIVREHSRKEAIRQIKRLVYAELCKPEEVECTAQDIIDAADFDELVDYLESELGNK